VPGVYISYPFCAQKCTYCNFASGVFPRELERRYVARLLAEIRSHRWTWTPGTVYLGGGTPSSIDPADLEHLLNAIPGRPWAEATIEAAPGSFSRERSLCWAQLGINRVSLGVQSFVESEIRRTGRKHSADSVAADIGMLRQTGLRNLNIDLIAGLSGQTESSWRVSLDCIERLMPEHVSVYMLEVDEDSRLGKEMMLGGVRYGASETPSDAQTADFYEIAVDRLAAMGIARYEISNFARPGFESMHNLKYWRLEPYAGFGADAHSFDGSERRQNPESVHDYLERRQVESVPARPDQERFFVGLRLREGIKPSAAESERFGDPIRRFLAAGLLEQHEGAIRLTDRGVLVSNEVFQEFIDL